MDTKNSCYQMKVNVLSNLTSLLNLEEMKSRINTNSLEELFSSVWELAGIHDFEDPILIESKKSEDEADRLRKLGNTYYQEKHFVKALHAYNESIRNAPHPVLTKTLTSQEKLYNSENQFMSPQIDIRRYGGTMDGENRALAMGYANRSAIMLELVLHDKCLHDIALALNYGYPEDLREKLEKRKQKCLSSLNEGKAVGPNESVSIIPADDSDVGQYCFDSVNFIQTMVQGPKIKNGVSSLKLLLSIPKDKYKKQYAQHQNIPSLSDALKVTWTPPKGRGVVAARDIRPGEVLAVERAYCMWLEKDKEKSFCSTCTCLSLTPLPCPGCTQVIFCSEECREIGLAEEHWLECKLFSSVIYYDMRNTGEAYKLLKTFTYTHVNDLFAEFQREKKENISEIPGFNKNGVYDSTSYYSVYHLLSNYKHCSLVEMVCHSFEIIFLLRLLKQSERYFISESGEPMTPTKKDLLLSGITLLSAYFKKETNSYGYSNGKDTFYNGIFPAISLANHSCNPAAVSVAFNREFVIRATRPIGAGEEVTISYGNFTFNKPEKDTKRQKTKEAYFQCFHCSCEACESDWPKYDAQPFLRFKCPVCLQPLINTFYCLPCIEQGRINREGELFSSIEEHCEVHTAGMGRVLDMRSKLEDNQSVSEEDLTFVCEYIEFLYKHVTPPCQAFYMTYDILTKCFHSGL